MIDSGSTIFLGPYNLIKEMSDSISDHCNLDKTKNCRGKVTKKPRNSCYLYD